jgi:hypothetical protein
MEGHFFSPVHVRDTIQVNGAIDSREGFRWRHGFGDGATLARLIHKASTSGLQQYISAVAFLIDVHEWTHGDTASIR